MPRRSTKSAPDPTQLVPTIKLLPYLNCPRNARAIEEIAATYLATLTRCRSIVSVIGSGGLRKLEREDFFLPGRERLRWVVHEDR